MRRFELLITVTQKTRQNRAVLKPSLPAQKRRRQSPRRQHLRRPLKERRFPLPAKVQGECSQPFRDFVGELSSPGVGMGRGPGRCVERRSEANPNRGAKLFFGLVNQPDGNDAESLSRIDEVQRDSRGSRAKLPE